MAEQFLFYNQIHRRTERVRRKQQEDPRKPIHYKVGDKVLVKNQQFPSTLEGISKKLLLLFLGPYEINQVQGPNTYKLQTVDTKRIIGVYNQTLLRPYYDRDYVPSTKQP